MVNFRKNRHGDWVVCGPVSEVVIGPVLVTKRDGSTRVVAVFHVGRPFTNRDGVRCVYGSFEWPSRAEEARLRDLLESPLPAGVVLAARIMCANCEAMTSHHVDAVDADGVTDRVCPACAEQPANHLHF